jgi:hypothetical protein
MARGLRRLHLPAATFHHSADLQPLQHLTQLEELAVAEIQVHAFLALPGVGRLRRLAAQRLGLWPWAKLPLLSHLTVTEEVLVPGAATRGALSSALPALEFLSCGAEAPEEAGEVAEEDATGRPQGVPWRDARAVLRALEGHPVVRELRVCCAGECWGWPSGVLRTLPALRSFQLCAALSEQEAGALCDDVAGCGGLQQALVVQLGREQVQRWEVQALAGARRSKRSGGVTRWARWLWWMVRHVR